MCIQFCMKVIPPGINYICVEWVLWSKMKRILGALLIEVSILNYVIWKDPFCGHFVESCSDFNVLVLISGTTVCSFPDYWFLFILIIVALCLLNHVARKLCYYCLMFIEKTILKWFLWNTTSICKWTPRKLNLSSGILEIECWSSILKQWRSLNFDMKITLFDIW